MRIETFCFRVRISFVIFFAKLKYIQFEILNLNLKLFI